MHQINAVVSLSLCGVVYHTSGLILTYVSCWLDISFTSQSTLSKLVKISHMMNEYMGGNWWVEVAKIRRASYLTICRKDYMVPLAYPTRMTKTISRPTFSAQIYQETSLGLTYSFYTALRARNSSTSPSALHSKICVIIIAGLSQQYSRLTLK